MAVRRIPGRALAVAGLAAGLVAGTSVLGALPVQQAVADGQSQDLYVSDVYGTCSDTGSGTYHVPFCTIGEAAAVVVPGQTVHVLSGDYNEAVRLTRSGTADAPITFLADRVDDKAVSVGDNNGQVTGDVFDLTGVQHIVLRGFDTIADAPGSDYRIDGSHDITVDQGSAKVQNQTAVLVTGGSSDVTVSRGDFVGVNSTPVRFESGSSGVIASNTFVALNATAVQLADAPGTDMVGNTVLTQCQGGAISVTGGSATIENNIVVQSMTNLALGNAIVPGACTGQPAPTTAAVTLDADSVSGSRLDYDIVDTPGYTPYAWGGTGYATAAALTAGTGQGAHESAADPLLVVHGPVGLPLLQPQTGSPAIDSADAGAPGETATDASDAPRADDPDVADSGAGDPGWFDRGAWEVRGGYHETDATVTPVAAGGPLEVQVNLPTAQPLWTLNGPLTWPTTVHFGDDDLPVVTRDSQATHVFRRAGAYPVRYTRGGASPGLGTVVVGAAYTPVTPQRLLDTRAAIGVDTTTPVPPGGDAVLHLPSIDGVAPSDISAIAANVTVTQPTAGGVLTVYPGVPGSGTSPTSSNLNFAKGQTVANMVTVPPGTDGIVDVHNYSKGTVHVLLDLAGIYADQGSYFKPTAPVRVLDTRTTLGGANSKPLAAGSPFTLDLSGKIPAGATAVAMNVTVTGETGGGHLTVYPAGTPLPSTSNISYSGPSQANQVLVPVSGGKVTFRTSGSSAHVIADLAGWFGPTSTGATSVYVPVGALRILDTRTDTVDNRPPGALAPHEDLEFYPYVHDGCTPGCPSPDALVLNVTATQATQSGYLTVYPGTLPTASTLNFTPGRTVPNQATVGGFTDVHHLLVHNGSSGTVQAVVDEEGYYMTQASVYV